MADQLEREGGHVVFVCFGNIHRSPMAEAIFKKKIEAYGYKCTVESAGLLDLGGEPAAPEWATHKFGKHFDLSNHRSRHIRMVSYTAKTFFICVDEFALELVQSLLKGVSPERILLLHPRGVHDPRTVGYDGCFTLIHTGISMLEERLGIH